MKKIVVIGGGYTGLVAALRLAQKGHAVTILERGQSLGGLAGDFEVEGAPLERAYHHLFKTDKDILAMVEELGITDKLEWHDSSVSIYYDHSLYSFKGALDLLKFKPLHFINRLRAGLVVLYLQKASNWEPLQKVSAYDWMRKYAGEQVTKVIWEPLLRGKFDKYFDKVSMAWLWARIHIRAQSREVGGEKLGYFRGGFRVFTDALVTELQKLNVDIQTSSEIKRIKSLPSKKVQIVFADNHTMTCDACVATTPSHVFGKLIQDDSHASQKYLTKLDSIHYLGARLLIFSSTQDISRYYWHNINDIDLPFLVFINHTKLAGKKFYNNKYVYYIATYVSHDHNLFTCSDKDLEDIWFPALRQVFPNFKLSLIREKHHFRFANAQHIVDANYKSKIPSYKTPLPHVYLSNFSQIYPEDRGTNYAVREGQKIANLVTEDIA